MRKNEVINGFRGVAILMVIYHHLFSKRFHLYFINKCGWIGVNLFFILSGFVLYRPYVTGERKFENYKDILLFYKNRFLRLYPLFIFSCIISFVFINKASLESLKSFLLATSTLSMFTQTSFFPLINGLTWSLIVEIWFSISFPFLVLLIKRYSFRKVIITIFLVALIIRFISIYSSVSQTEENTIKDFFLARIDDFMVGMLICKIYIQRQEIINQKRFSYFMIGITSLLIGCLIWDLKFKGRLPNIAVIFTNNFFQLGFGLLIIYGLNISTFLNKILIFRPLQWIGLICFSIYIWHELMIPIFIKNHSLIEYISYFTVLIILAALSYIYLENKNSRTNITVKSS